MNVPYETFMFQRVYYELQKFPYPWYEFNLKPEIDEFL